MEHESRWIDFLSKSCPLVKINTIAQEIEPLINSAEVRHLCLYLGETVVAPVVQIDVQSVL
jgi:hypothetical protein